MKKAIGPRQLTEDEARDTARRAYSGNTCLSSADIGKAIGRARRTVDAYIADLRAVNQMDTDIKIFRMYRLGIPQDRIAKRLGMDQKTIHTHIIQAPLSSQRFSPVVVSAMQKKGILGVISRYVIVLDQNN